MSVIENDFIKPWQLEGTQNFEHVGLRGFGGVSSWSNKLVGLKGLNS